MKKYITVCLNKEFCNRNDPNLFTWAHTNKHEYHNRPLALLPSNDTIEILNNLNITFEIMNPWTDSCSIYLINPSEHDLTMVKLIFNPDRIGSNISHLINVAHRIQQNQ